MQSNRDRTSRYSCYSNLCWVSSEGGDIGLHPLQGENLIFQSEVGGIVHRSLNALCESPNPYSILNRNKDDRLSFDYRLANEISRIVCGSRAFDESTSIDPYHDW